MEDAAEELERLKKEQKEAEEELSAMFPEREPEGGEGGDKE